MFHYVALFQHGFSCCPCTSWSWCLGPCSSLSTGTYLHLYTCHSLPQDQCWETVKFCLESADPRIRTLPLTYGYGSGSCFFRQWLTKCQQKTIFFSKYFCLLLFEGTFTSVFIGKKSKRSNKIVEISYNFVCWWKDRDPYLDPDPEPVQNNDGSGSGIPKNIRIRIHITARDLCQICLYLLDILIQVYIHDLSRNSIFGQKL